MASNNSSNSTLFECPWDFSTSAQLTVLILCLICFVLAVGGNILVLLAVYRTRSLRYTSMYFLASLSVADLMVGSIMGSLYVFMLVIMLYFSNDFSDDFFKAFIKVENFFWASTLTATTFSLCSVSIDRYIAVTFSLRYREIVTTGRCTVSIVMIWVFSFGIAATLFIFGDDDSKRGIYWIVCFIITVALPFLVILFCNIKLAIEARRHVRLIHRTSVRSSDNDGSSTARRTRARNQKATITAVIVSGIFFALFFPQLAVFIMISSSWQDVCFVYNELQVAWYWVAAVSFFHSAVNPWIYCIRSREFRKAIGKQLFCHQANTQTIAALN